MIYMNNAATSYPKPQCVSDAVADNLNNLPKSSHRAVQKYNRQEIGCRGRLAELMELDKESRIAYAANSTLALNMGLLGFPWKKGDVVLITSAEHNSVLRPLYYLKKRGELDFYILPGNQDGRLGHDTFQKALEKFRPRMAVLTHGSNVTGAVNNAKKLAEMAKPYGTTIFLDASQTLGIIPVLPLKWNIDMVAFTGHKYLLGPQGAGGLYISDKISLEAVITGGTGINSEEVEMPFEMPLHLEAGTQNEPSFDGLNAALAWQKEYPVPLNEILTKVHRIESTLDSHGYKTIKVEGVRTPVIAFTSPRYDTSDIGDILLGSYDIICRTGLHCAPKILESLKVGGAGTVRISLSRFTTNEEVDVLIEALEEMAKDG